MPRARIGQHGAELTGVVHNATHVKFTTQPGMQLGDFHIEVNFNDQDWFPVLASTFHVYRRAVFATAAPISGPVRGGTVVTLAFASFFTGSFSARLTFSGDDVVPTLVCAQ